MIRRCHVPSVFTRLLTPFAEILLAGHPLVGTGWFVLEESSSQRARLSAGSGWSGWFGELVIHQEEEVGRPSRIGLRWEGERVEIGGAIRSVEVRMLSG